jgi:hypothetical protein
MHFLRSASFALFAAVLTACAHGHQPPPDGGREATHVDAGREATHVDAGRETMHVDAGREATHVDTGSAVPLRAALPADSLVARRGGATIFLSAAEVDAYLTEFFQEHPNVYEARELQERVRREVRQAGWAMLSAKLGGEREWQDLLLAEFLEQGRASVRDRTGALVRGVRLHRIRTDLWGGRRFVLPGGGVLLEVVDVLI